MAIGIQPSKTDLDGTMGGIAKSLNQVFDQVRQMEAWLASQADADLEANYGYTAQEVANFKSAFGDLDQLRTIYEGGAPLGTAKDFRTFARLIWGFGF